MGLPQGNPELARSIGPGEIFVGLTSAVTLPVELPTVATPFDVALLSVGATESGSVFSNTTERIASRIAESMPDFAYKAGPTAQMLAFSMVEVGPKNLSFAIPGATVTTTTAGSVRVDIPRAAGNERYTVVWVSTYDDVALVLPRCFVSMTGEINNYPQDDGSLPSISVECAVEDPGPGISRGYWIYASTIADLDPTP